MDLENFWKSKGVPFYTDRHVYTYSKIFSQTFWLFWPPFKENPETNDTSFESPNTQLIDSEFKFDLIVMNNLIEHVVDPIVELRTAKRLLKTGGKIFIETPNTNSWDFRLMQKFWGGLHTPRHTFLFNPQSMGVICKITKLEIHKIFYPINTDHWALSIQNLLQSCNRFKLKLRNGRTWYFKYLLFFFYCHI